MTYRPLPVTTLQPETGFQRPFFSAPRPAKVSASALEVMTDLNFVAAATAGSGLDVETATQKMIARGVRSLLVIDGANDVIGIVTSRDLIGERPQRIMHERHINFGELRVQDVMTPAAEIEVLPLTEVLHARVGDIIETLKHSGRQHALVVEQDSANGKPMIRGIFSASQIARQLGVPLDKHELEQTFAAIDRAIQSAG
ncbi:MAG TPA: CBS domain-containing protein [Usitatibacteraceae bacterium]|nr:CBS domain-containing protein [Usitatibacteraceae bacterium]